MPAIRKTKDRLSKCPPRFANAAFGARRDPNLLSSSETGLPLKQDINYPTSGSERDAFRTLAGKRVTPHRWAVYDFARKIPTGKVTTYKHICQALGEGSPRSVGAALRNNPFAPFVPCHRVIASNLFIGGFFGEWGSAPSKGGDKGPNGSDNKTIRQCDRKIQMLAEEGISFTREGFLIGGRSQIWEGDVLAA